MTELLTAGQMRAIEQAAIESGEVTGLELMERAGRGVVEAIFEEWPQLAKTSHRAVVLCGPGNNGGDGFVVARLLKEWGWEVEVLLYGDAQKLPPDARVNHERWTALGPVRAAGEVLGTEDLANLQADLLVDALFGTGLARPLPGDVGAFLDFSRQPGLRGGGFARTVAIDIPSGLCSDSGRVIAPPAHRGRASTWAVKADLSVSFHARKVGHAIGDGPGTCGKVVVKDIGLKADADPAARAGLDRHAAGSRLAKRADSHKYGYGHVLVLSGPSPRGGAARLSARGALRIGAGLVTVAAPPDAVRDHAARLDAIMVRPCAEADALAGILDDDRLNALCLGPGLGATEATRALARAALGADRATVLDADALTAFADEPKTLFDLLHENVVLTPHAGEFARLFPDIAEKLDAPATTGPAYSKVDATREAAARAGCTILFKGPDTVIADQAGRCAINSSAYERAAPWLATAGAGDVLAGMIAGLLARGFSPMHAAETAAWLHTECALSFGPGLIAEDLPEQLPGVFRALGL